MQEKTIIIIGAGIAGLSTGIYGQANGYQTLLLEMHDKPGGLCTAWKRKDYVFDGCIHHLAGAGPDSKYYPIWEELGASQLKMDFHDLFVRCETADGSQFNLLTNIDRLKNHLQELAPEDRKLIDHYISAVRRFTNFELLGLPLYNKSEMASLALHLIHLPRWMKLENRFPGLGQQVEVVDVATPVTTERFTGNYEGRQTWTPPRSGFNVMLKGLSRTLPGLEQFYMVGQWADAMIGISTAALSGRKFIQHLCKQERRPFQVPLINN